MVYCPKCGKQNADDARYCNSCGKTLMPGTKGFEREWDDRCDEGCSGRGRSGLWFWGIVVVLIGVWFVLEVGVKNMRNPPTWIVDFDWGWIFGVIVGAIILAFGVSMIVKASKRQ